MMKNKIPAAAAALAAGAALALTGCAGPDPSAAPQDDQPTTSSQAPAAFNEADVMFTQGMVPHHEQAIEMSDMLLAKEGVDTGVAELAEQIKDAQGPEIEQMNAWLEAWGAEGDMGGMDHGEMDQGGMNGMMSAEDMAALEAAPGPEASSLFLEQMIQHHEGAITMAEQETAEGESPDAVALAEQIATEQQAEIEQMQALQEAL